MTQMLMRAGVALLFLAPSLAFASTVTLTTDAIVTSGGVTLNVSGGTNTMDSLVVGANSFTFVIGPSEYVSVTSANGYTITSNAQNAYILSQSCSGGTSNMQFTSNGNSNVSITVTPTTALCSTSSGGGGPVSSGGGGGGGGGGGSSPVVYGTVPATTPTPKSSSSLTTTQIDAIISLLQSFGADASVIANVQASLSGSVPPGIVVATAASGKLTLALRFGLSGVQVKLLQQMLNMDKDTQIASSGAGSPGMETTTFGGGTLAAVKKFQVKWNIAKSGDAGYGNVGPATRAKLNELYGK